MATTSHTAWYLRRPSGWVHFQSLSFSRLLLLYLAVFALFSTFGFYGDLASGGRLPYIVVLLAMMQSGLTAVLWIYVLSRLSMVFLIIPIALSISNAWTSKYLDSWLIGHFGMGAVPTEAGIHFSANGMMAAIILSYTFFVMFIRKEGKETFKLKNELELAQGIQKTLVPPFTLRTERFEIYGISKPSEKVGGDLVDALVLANGDAIAYVGDIAGHGLQAGILMGMLKTAARTALLDAAEREPCRTLPALLDRLNTVLPGVKEEHMYATFTAFRLGVDGSVYYALAASPPILHWHSGRLALSRLEEEQFPLGLLPVSDFNGRQLEMAPGDLLTVATDGILEACDPRGDEFGIDRLERTISAHADAALPELAERILDAARDFGKQADDQTILLIRCL